MELKGVVLAGGLGTRLYPITKVVNKHLLPIWDKPMIYYPIQTLVNAGITEILIVLGGNTAGEFIKLLGDGKELGIRSLYYAYQRGEGGIADALLLAEGFVGDDRSVVILGDNVIEGNIIGPVERFKRQRSGARILLKEVPDPQRFGVIEIDEAGKPIRIIEKPQNPPSNLAVTGIYMYDARVFDMIKTLKPSERGELEITDVNNMYIHLGEMEYDFIEGWWMDAGTFESLLQTSTLVAKTGANKVKLEDRGLR